jgi:hypothetical protein
MATLPELKPLLEEDGDAVKRLMAFGGPLGRKLSTKARAKRSRSSAYA